MVDAGRYDGPSKEKTKDNKQMGFITGLAGVQEELAKRPTGDYEDRPKARWVSIPAGGAPIKLIPLQELDEGSPNYSAKNGLGIFSLEHSGVPNWKKSAKCTLADEGDCYGCAQGWKQKIVLYLNVLVDDGNEEPYVAIFSRGLGKGSVAQSLLDMAADSDFDNSITDKEFKFSRSGKGKEDTTYTLSPLPKAHGKNVEDFELYDLEKYVFTVKAENQQKYYMGDEVPAASEAKVPVSASSVDQDW